VFKHRSIHTFVWASPNERTHNQIGHTFKGDDMNALDAQSFRGLGSDMSHYLAFAEFRERLAVSKYAMQELDMESLNFSRLSEVSG
jgi:hypothetical protein